jgi:hypothetical protein
MNLSSVSRSEDKWMGRRAVVAPGGWCSCCCCWCHCCCHAANQAIYLDPEEL